MDTIAYGPYLSEDTLADAVEPVDRPVELVERSDAVGIHAPLTEETREAVGETELEALGADGVLVNAARGPIVDADALRDALDRDPIHGAAMDVFDEEPAPADRPLFEVESVLVTPHIAGSTAQSVPAKQRGAARNVRMVFDGKLPDSTVNRDQLCLRAAHGRNGPAESVDTF
jgi:phosphoglycerate dehydrogenase-like enzyme